MSARSRRASNPSRGGAPGSDARNPRARPASRAVAPISASPGIPPARARATGRPMAPSPRRPTRRRGWLMRATVARWSAKSRRRRAILRAMARGISAARASRLRGPLERLYRRYDYEARVGSDAIQYPARYQDPLDREIVALLSACLAYGRVTLFGPWVVRLLDW